jgi:hypothetical protein
MMLLNQGVSATQNLVNSAQNEKQAIAGYSWSWFYCIITKQESRKKKMQSRLENEKQQILKKII